MTDYKTYDFVAGDILEYEGECYQVHENLGMTGLAAPFPAVDVEPTVVEWNDGYQKLGHQALPAPTPCASGSCKPPVEVVEFRRHADDDSQQPVKFVEAC